MIARLVIMMMMMREYGFEVRAAMRKPLSPSCSELQPVLLNTESSFFKGLLLELLDSFASFWGLG